MTDRVPVQFLRHHDRYNAGEVAGFEANVARNLINLGIAEPYDAAAAAAAAASKEAQEDELAARAADLAAREAALAEREAALATDPGQPPAQGGADKSGKK